MRLIDADALIGSMKLLEESYRRCGAIERAEAYTNCLWEIKQAPTVGGWVSVKDRLPKSMINKVLVWLEHEDLNGYIGYGHYEKFHGEEMWYDLEHDERFDKRGYIVTHWMPLPEPPKENVNGDMDV